MFCCTLLYVDSSYFNHLDGEERAGYFVWFVFLMLHACCMFFSREAIRLSTVCDREHHTLSDMTTT